LNVAWQVYLNSVLERRKQYEEGDRKCDERRHIEKYRNSLSGYVYHLSRGYTHQEPYHAVINVADRGSTAGEVRRHAAPDKSEFRRELRGLSWEDLVRTTLPSIKSFHYIFVHCIIWPVFYQFDSSKMSIEEEEQYPALDVLINKSQTKSPRKVAELYSRIAEPHMIEWHMKNDPKYFEDMREEEELPTISPI